MRDTPLEVDSAALVEIRASGNRDRIPLYCVADSCKGDGKSFMDSTDMATYPPHALGMILAYALSLADISARYALVPRWIATAADLRAAYDVYGPGIYLFSDYVWTLRNNLLLSEQAKLLDERSITIHGGPSFPKYPDASSQFFKQYPHVDVGVRGEGEQTVVDLLRAIAATWPQFSPAALSGVASITFRGSGAEAPSQSTPERVRNRNLGALPSPYLTGLYEQFEDSPDSWTAAILETNRGCPYGCTFCDWGSATVQKILQFPLERITAEIEWCGIHRVSRLWIADANFGIFDRDVMISEQIAETKARFGYPRDVIVNYAKNATPRLTEIIRIFRKAQLTAQGIISIQTHDRETLEIIQRANIKTARYEQLIDVFRRERLPISSDLMIGLPGATVASFKNDLQFFIDRQVHTVAYPAMVLPNSPMADAQYMTKHEIKVDQNGYITSTRSYSMMDLGKMTILYGAYRAAFHYSVLKYLLHYAQVDHGIRAIDFLEALVQHLMMNVTGKMPHSRRILMKLCMYNRREDLMSLSEAQWRDFYEEVVAFSASRLGLPRSSPTTAVVEAQIAIMPYRGRTLPQMVAVEHDVVAYFEQMRFVKNLGDRSSYTIKPLSSFDAGFVHVEDPHGICDGAETPWDGHHPPMWELSARLLNLAV